jgi:hypothetical protein
MNILTIGEQHTAHSEGWVVVNNEGRKEIQKCEVSGRFANDWEAVGFVYYEAMNGSALHQRAILGTIASTL